MIRSKFPLALAAALALATLAAPAAADKVLTVMNHTDEFQMMGQKTPAQDVTHTYWFGDEGIRYDMGETSVITRLDQKKLYFVNHEEKNYSAIDLPINFEQLVGPEMAPMMKQMAQMMAATVKVTPTDRSGVYGGIACKFSRVEISMQMMQMTQDTCLTKELPIDYSRYQELAAAQAEMMPNMDWAKKLAEQLDGFSIRADVTTTVMGKAMKSWHELQSVEDKATLAGHYAPPSNYKEIKYDPMAQMQQQGRR